MASGHEIPRLAEFETVLRERLPEPKAAHCVSVARFLAPLAEPLALNPEEVAAATLLHDICRALDRDTLLRRAEDYGLEISPAQREAPALLHGPCAAEECRRTLGVTSPAVYEAIYWHTTGRPGLGRLGQALYFGDFSEPLRHYPEAAVAREKLAVDGFDAALRYVAGMKIHFLQKKRVVDPVTAAFRQWLCPGDAP